MSDTPNFTPGDWRAIVKCVSHGFKENGYAHCVVIGDNEWTVGSSRQRNYESIEKTPVDGTLFRFKGVGRIEPDYTPCADAYLIAAAPDLYAALDALLKNNLGPQVDDGAAWDACCDMARAALAKARGHR